VRVVADNAANITGTITACSATLNHKYNASLALTDGALTAGTDLGTHSFTWTSPNATAVTSNSTTVYTGSQTNGHELTFTSITAGNITYTGISVTFNKTFEPGKTYRLTVRFKGTVPIIPTGAGTPPTNTPYVGAFWKHDQTGERLIRIPVGTIDSNLGNWSAIVAWVDGQWDGLGDIVLDTSESTDEGITWNSTTEIPADPDDINTYGNAYQVSGNATGVGGTVESGDTIKFRIGLKNTYSASDTYPARYALVVVTYGSTPAKTFTLFLRQGEDPDYVWSPSESYPDPENGSTLRDKAVKFSPYNLTALDLTDSDEHLPVAIGGGVFTAYPTQVGAFFQWANATNQRYAYHPVNPPVPDEWNTSYTSGHWNSFSGAYETCPQTYPLSTGTTVNFRRPNDGSTSANSGGAIAGSELRQSLWEEPPTGTNSSTVGSVWGFYADGFFDRRSHTHGAYGGGVANTAVSIMTKDAAYVGRLFFNQVNKRSLFFPASGFRRYSDGTFSGPGSYGGYWSSSSNGATTGSCLGVTSVSVGVGSSSRSFGFALRCVRDEP
jgi:hypothetical protein